MPDSEWMFALYRPGTDLGPIVERLHQYGIPQDAIEILSAVPLSEEVSNEKASATWGRVPIYLLTMVAGLIGIAGGIFFAAGTAAMYPIPTGGKPIVARPVVGIISYELMMLVAIVTTCIVAVIRMIAIRRRISQYDPRIDDGYLGLLVRATGDDGARTQIRQLLHGDSLVELRTAA